MFTSTLNRPGALEGFLNGVCIIVGRLLARLPDSQPGEILFGISVIRAGVYSKVAAILFMAGLIPVALHPSGIFPESVVNIGATAVGIGLIWWSIEFNRLVGTKIDSS